MQKATSLPYFGLVINNGALGIAIVMVAFRSTKKVGNFTQLVISTFDFCLSLSSHKKFRALYCEILACNNIIACRGVPIVSLGENDLIRTSYCGFDILAGCLLCHCHNPHACCVSTWNGTIGNHIMSTCRNDIIGMTQYGRLCHFGAYCDFFRFPCNQT